MVIAYLLGQYPTVSHSFVYREIASLQQHDVRVDVYGLSRHSDPDHQILPMSDIRWVPSAHSVVLAEAIPDDLAEQWISSGGRKKDLRRARWLARRWKMSGVECVHTHFVGFATALAAVACRIAKIPLVVTVHARGIFVPGPLMELSFDGAASIIAISDRTAQTIRAKSARDSTVFPVPVALAPCSPPTESPLHLLTVGRPVPKKGYPTMRMGIQRLSRPYRWTVAGAHEDEIGGPLPGLTALGSVPFQDIESVYREGVDVFVLACCEAPDGDVDGVPVAIMEAMARGVAVVSTNVGSIGELVIHNETGVLVPPDDPQAIADAINRLAEDPDLRQKLAAQGRDFVRSTRLVSTHARVLLEHLKHVAESHVETQKNLS